ncbi:MAG: DOPA 4,5-dioxygenase family protein [Pikeienuella sp.]
MSEFQGFHAHVYFDADSIAQAKSLCEQAAERFGIRMGRMHEKPVGPHPEWSCQLSVPTELFGTVIPWLSKNRNGLTLFIHGETGDHLADHTDYAIWMGKMPDLDLSIFG